MFRIQTVCTGNICRSPMAQFTLDRGLAAAGTGARRRVAVDSSGLTGWEAGKPMDRRAAAELRRHGYPDAGISAFRAREFQPEWFSSLDLILAMDYGHYLDLLQQAPATSDRAKVMMLRAFDPALQTPGGRPGPSPALSIEDPWYGNQRDFETAYALIEAAVPGVVDYVDRLRANSGGSPHER